MCVHPIVCQLGVGHRMHIYKYSLEIEALVVRSTGWVQFKFRERETQTWANV